jgi:hypothetical protein
MLNTFLETVSWGITGTMCSTILCIIFNIDNKKSFRNIVIVSTILGMIRGYTGKDMITLLLSE